MRWQGRRESSNVDDRRRMGGGAISGIGGIGLVLIVLVGWFFGIDLSPLLQQGGPVVVGGQRELTEADEQAASFAKVVLADTEEVWDQLFREQVGDQYVPPTLVLFSGMTQSACGGASAATGPFYCPNDRQVYLDTDFFATMSRQLGARGDFAAAYVVAHEVAHYVQDQLGILSQANTIRMQVGEAESNAISVRIELQADCYSGVWARHAEINLGTIERGDIDEAMNAAAQIGDDTLQRRQTGTVRPDSFTHGTSEQRQRWFWQGYDTGDLRSCDTFGTDRI